MTATTNQHKAGSWFEGLQALKPAVALQWRAAWRPFSVSIVLTVLASAAPAASAAVMREILDGLASPHPNIQSVTQAALALAAVNGCVSVIPAVTQYTQAIVALRLNRLATCDLFQRVSTFHGLRQFEQPAFHDRLALAQQAAQQIPQIAGPIVQNVLATTTVLLTFAIGLVAIWPPVLILLLGGAGIALVLRSMQATHAVKAQLLLAPLGRRQLLIQYALTNISAAKEMRLFGFSGYFQSLLTTQVEESVAVSSRFERKRVVSETILGLVSAVLGFAALLVLVRGVVSHRFAIGDVAFFVAAFAAVQGAVGGMVSQVTQLRRARVLLDAYSGVIDAKDDIPNGELTPAALKNGIGFHGVWFRYDDSLPWVFRGLDLFIAAGEVTALVGLNGAGKSTLFKLLCRLYDPDHGYISWDGVDLREFDLELLRTRLTGCFQDNGQYDLSVRENIGLGDVAQIDDLTRIESLAEAVGLSDAIQALPGGFETFLSRSVDAEAPTAMLSGGEWQRLGLARCLMRDAAAVDVLILDEATASVDAHGESCIYEAVTATTTRQHLTVIVISHRFSVMKDADSICVLQDGVLRETGQHDDLVARGGLYASLYRTEADHYDRSLVLRCSKKT